MVVDVSTFLQRLGLCLRIRNAKVWVLSLILSEMPCRSTCSWISLFVSRGPSASTYPAVWRSIIMRRQPTFPQLKHCTAYNTRWALWICELCDGNSSSCCWLYCINRHALRLFIWKTWASKNCSLLNFNFEVVGSSYLMTLVVWLSGVWLWVTTFKDQQMTAGTSG